MEGTAGGYLGERRNALRNSRNLLNIFFDILRMAKCQKMRTQSTTYRGIIAVCMFCFVWLFFFLEEMLLKIKHTVEVRSIVSQ